MSQYKVALHGFEIRSAERFRNLFFINFRGKYAVTEQADQQIDLVDIDTYSADLNALLSQLAPASTILLSDQDKFPADFVGLQKPAKINALAELLDQALAKKLSANGSTAPRIASRSATSYSSSSVAISEKIGEVAALAEVKTLRQLDDGERYRAADFFLSLFLEAYQLAAEHDYVELRNWNNERFILSRRQNLLWSDVSKNQFISIASVAIPQGLRSKTQIQALSQAPDEVTLNAMQQLPLERALWKLAYSTSRGRLPQELNSSDKYSLRKWPNFTRLPRMKNGMRIAAVWTGCALSPAEVAEQLQIELTEVQAFLVACNALALLQTSAKQESKPTRSSRSSGIFHSLLGHLSSAFSNKKLLQAS